VGNRHFTLIRTGITGTGQSAQPQSPDAIDQRNEPRILA
jgi:hypothetical protein